MMTILLGVIAAGLIGGWLSRMAGGAPPKLPFGLDQWLYSLPYFLVSFPVVVLAETLPRSHYIVDPKRRIKTTYHPAFYWTWSGLVYLTAVIGKRTGHGGGIDLGHSPKEAGYGRDPEKLEYLILWLRPKMSAYAYDALLLAITGLIVTLPAGIMLGFFHLPAGVVLALSGLSKAPAYMIGWAVYPEGTGRGIPHLNEATAIGEFLTGFFAYVLLALCAVWAFQPADISATIEAVPEIIMIAQRGAA